MGLENFESHPDASGGQLLTEHLRDKHRGKSYGMSTSGHGGQILCEALIAARLEHGDLDWLIFVDTRELKDPQSTNHIGVHP
eukprot:545990-Pyramimonas_sp.AAC.1